MTFIVRAAREFGTGWVYLTDPASTREEPGSAPWMANELKAAHFTTREDAVNAMARPALHWESRGLSNPIDRAEIVESAA